MFIHTDRRIAIGFVPPAITSLPQPMQNVMPNIISLPYGRCPPLHFMAPNWRHLLKLMARLSGTRVEPTVEALAVVKTDLHLRVVVQFIRVKIISRSYPLLLIKQFCRIILLPRTGALLCGSRLTTHAHPAYPERENILMATWISCPGLILYRHCQMCSEIALIRPSRRHTLYPPPRPYPIPNSPYPSRTSRCTSRLRWMNPAGTPTTTRPGSASCPR